MNTPEVPFFPTGEQILFSAKSLDFTLENEEVIIEWLNAIISQENKTLQQLEVIFMTDEELLDMNKKYLNHDFYTDIITFPHQYEPIFAELYISIDRVRDNANTQKIAFQNELNRVIVHGLLHLCGYDDHSEDDIKRMRIRENEALAFLLQSQ